jgi:hypothetical protein
MSKVDHAVVSVAVTALTLLPGLLLLYLALLPGLILLLMLLLY